MDRRTNLEIILDRLPGWPSERQWVTIGMFFLGLSLLGMAGHSPTLWDIEVFKVIIQAVFLTGLLNMILAFHFAANKSDENRSINTGKAFDAIKAAQESVGTDTGAIREGDEVVLEKK